MNFDYQIKRYNDYIFYLEAQSKIEINDLLASSIISCHQGNEFRKASIQALSILSGRGPLNIIHTDIEAKNQRQIFKIYFKETKKPFSIFPQYYQ